MATKSAKEYSVVFLVEGEKFNLREKFRLKVQFALGLHPLLSVLLRTRSAHRLSSQLFSAVSTPNITELAPSGFFCPQPGFLRRSKHLLPGKTPFSFDRQLATGKEISSKINIWQYR